jgi:hypothetical protein
MACTATALTGSFPREESTLPLPLLLTAGYETESDPTVEFLEIEAAAAAKYDPLRQLLPDEVFAAEIYAKNKTKSPGICSATDGGIDYSVRDTVSDD